MREATDEELDLQQRSKKRNKVGGGEESRKSYSESVRGGFAAGKESGEGLEEDGDVSDDDVVEEGDSESWFGMGMTRQEKMAARRPWKNSLIVKVVGRAVGFQFLCRRIQAMWRTKSTPLMIDLSNDYYIVRVHQKEEYNRALLDGPWMIGEHYLHVQKWRPNFRPEKEVICSMPVWVRFPRLPLEYYKEGWLQRAGNMIGRTIKVDMATLIASRGKFARVCVDVDFGKPLMTGYKMRGEFWNLQYEGLHDICFDCGKFGHRAGYCPEKRCDGVEETENCEPMKGRSITASRGDGSGSCEAGYGEWMTVQRGRRRRPETTAAKTTVKGKEVISQREQTNNSVGGDRGASSDDRAVGKTRRR